jgi:hypothetical protein
MPTPPSYVSADLKSSVHPLTWFYQTILGSIYRRFGRQSKVTSYLVSQGESLIFPSSLIVSSRVCLSTWRNTFTVKQECGVLLEVAKSRIKSRNGPITGRCHNIRTATFRRQGCKAGLHPLFSIYFGRVLGMRSVAPTLLSVPIADLSQTNKSASTSQQK